MAMIIIANCKKSIMYALGIFSSWMLFDNRGMEDDQTPLEDTYDASFLNVKTTKLQNKQHDKT